MKNTLKRPGGVSSGIIINIFPWLSLILVIAVFGVLSGGRLFSAYTLKTVFSQAVIYIIGGLGLSFLFAQGAFDLSFGSTVCLSSILTALICRNTDSLILWILLPCVFCLAVGLLNGVLYAYAGMIPFIQTLSVSFLIKGTFTTLMGGEGGFNVPAALCKIDSLEWNLAIMLVMAVVCIVIFNYTSFGKHSRFYGAGQTACEQSGVNIKRVKLLAFVAAGLTAGVVTLMSIARAGKITTSTGNNFEFTVMIALTLGGMPAEGGTAAKIRSVFIGCLVVSVLTTGMVLIGLDARMQEVIKGLVFILVLIFTMKLKDKTANVS